MKYLIYALNKFITSNLLTGFVSLGFQHSTLPSRPAESNKSGSCRHQDRDMTPLLWPSSVTSGDAANLYIIKIIMSSTEQIADIKVLIIT